MGFMIHAFHLAVIRQNGNHLHHARMHVEEEMAMKCPIAHMVGGDEIGKSLPRLDDNRMLARQMIALAIFQIEKHAMQMDRVRHHGVVNENHTNPLTFAHFDRLFDIGKTHPVKGPHIAFHIRGEMQLNLAAWWSGIGVWL